MANTAIGTTSLMELWSSSSLDEIQAVIRAAYKQVLGNAHLMDSERLKAAESQLCDRKLTVRDFVRAIAKSDLYRERFFESSTPYRFVELNFKHLLGRAPIDQGEVSEHIRRCVDNGYEAEIDSYIDSNEYNSAFGENIVPYYRGASSQVGQKQVAYNRIFDLVRGFAETSKAYTESRLAYGIGTNSTTKIKSASGVSSTEKRFKISVTGAKFDAPRRRSNTEYIVSASKMTPQIQRIHRAGGKIVSITEIL